MSGDIGPWVSAGRRAGSRSSARMAADPGASGSATSARTSAVALPALAVRSSTSERPAGAAEYFAPSLQVSCRYACLPRITMEDPWSKEKKFPAPKLILWRRAVVRKAVRRVPRKREGTLCSVRTRLHKVSSKEMPST